MNDNQNDRIEFKVFNLNIETFSVFYGSFLIFWGLVVSFVSGSNSLTSFIPSFIGLPILIFSNLSIKFSSKKKLFMHIVVLFGLIAFLGGLDFLRSLISGSAFENLWADVSKIILLITGAFFTYQCVRSFIFARKNNK
tara:strand:- start:68 stop:481 length:414 start_codon:yes stop_codon:yes gene_type:complete